MANQLSCRALAQLRLALLRDCGCETTLAALDMGARQAGLTGAEIDAALDGKSFEARTAATLAFACAVKDGREHEVNVARARALRLGVTAQNLETVAREAAAILAGEVS
jgi:hypothetical protein